MKGISSPTENNRRAKYYMLTTAGRATLRRDMREWRRRRPQSRGSCKPRPVRYEAGDSQVHRRTRGALRQCHAEQDLDDEVRAYLEASIENRMRTGLSRAAAARIARAEVGSIEAVKDYTRDVGWATRLANVWRDLPHAARLAAASELDAEVAGGCARRTTSAPGGAAEP